MNDEREEKKLLMEKFKIAAEIQDNYNKLFWDRTNVFFVIVSALFAAYGLIATKILEVGNPGTGTSEDFAFVLVSLALVLVFIGVFGALLSRLWLIIHKRASEHQNAFRKSAWKLENKIKIEPMIFDKSRITEDEKLDYESGLVRILFILFRIPQKKKDTQDETSSEDHMVEGRSYEKHKNDKQQVRSESLRRTLDRVFLAFILIWIALSFLGIAIFVRSLF